MTKFAIGCLVQWYESEIIDEYLDTLEQAVKVYDGEVIVDVCLIVNEELESAADQKIKTVLRLCFHDDFEVSAHATYARAPRRMSDSNFCKDLSDVKRGRIERQIPLFKKNPSLLVLKKKRFLKVKL